MAALPSGLPETVDDGEDLARFLTSSGQFNTRMAKPAAFLPNPKNGETSLFRHGSEPLTSLREIGVAHITSERTLHAAAICKASQVRAAQLEVAAKEPPPRHANIIGWPWSETDPDFGKSERKELAALIARDANLIML